MTCVVRTVHGRGGFSAINLEKQPPLPAVVYIYLYVIDKCLVGRVALRFARKIAAAGEHAVPGVVHAEAIRARGRFELLDIQVIIRQAHQVLQLGKVVGKNVVGERHLVRYYRITHRFV